MGMEQNAVFGGNAINVLRAVIAAIIAAAFIGLVILLAAVLTATALVIAGIGALGGGAFWLYRKVRGRKTKTRSEPDILEAHRGPHGWTVDGKDHD